MINLVILKILLILSTFAVHVTPLARGVVVGIGRLLRRPHLSGTLRRFTRMRVHVDERPRIESTSTSSTASSFAHFRILRLPPLEPRERRLLVGRIRNNDQRHAHALLRRRLLAPATARHAAPRLPSSRKCGGHGASPKPAASSRVRQLEQLLERAGRCIHLGMRIANLSKTLRHCQHSEIRRLAVRELHPTRAASRRARRASGRTEYAEHVVRSFAFWL